MDQKNNLDWKKYENITKYIYETLRRDYQINIEGYGSDCKVRGHSGVNHQIDVLTSETDDSETYRTAIECKYWNKKVNKDIVMKLLSVINDTDIKKGIIVSKSGFTRDAMQFAKHSNILIVHLKEAEKNDTTKNKDIQICDVEFNIKMTLNRPEVLSIVAVDIENNSIVLDERYQYAIMRECKNGNKYRLFDDIMTFKNYLHEQKPFEIVIKEYIFEKSKLSFNDKLYVIKSITFSGLLTIRNDNHTKIFSIMDKVWLIMKKIFEQQTFIISEYGMIVNSTNDSNYGNP